MADVFDQIGAVGHEALVDADGERPRAGLRIVERELDVELSVRS